MLLDDSGKLLIIPCCGIIPSTQHPHEHPNPLRLVRRITDGNGARRSLHPPLRWVRVGTEGRFPDG